MENISQDKGQSLRARFYIDPEVQFPLILTFIFLATAQGFLVGWAFYKLIAIAKQWDRPDQALEFFRVFLLTVVPVVAVNFALGIWLSHKIAGPLVQIRRAVNEVSRGNLEVEVQLRGGDLLNAPAQDLNRMIATIRRLVYRDHDYVGEANDILTTCEKQLGRGSKISSIEIADLTLLLKKAKAKLSIVNAHFMKGRGTP